MFYHSYFYSHICFFMDEYLLPENISPNNIIWIFQLSKNMLFSKIVVTKGFYLRCNTDLSSYTSFMCCVQQTISIQILLGPYSYKWTNIYSCHLVPGMTLLQDHPYTHDHSPVLLLTTGIYISFWFCLGRFK